jgi:hypothetical protein
MIACVSKSQLSCSNGLFVVVVAILGLELRVYILSSHSTSPFSVMGVFKMGCCELFAQVGFEP